LAVILLVEDEIFIRESAQWVLEDLGHSILSACDIGEAFLHLGSSQHIDALFVDIRLNKVVLGGYDIANQAVKSRPNLRVLYTSGTLFNAEMKAFFVEGAHFLQKPYRESQLQNSVEGLLAASF
jgi:CheY-like chemotaxis protein